MCVHRCIYLVMGYMEHLQSHKPVLYVCTGAMGDTGHLKTLIRDTLLMLCRQGVEREQRFAVHAVIGVTVDDNQSFYLHIDENVDSPSIASPGRQINIAV